MAFQYSINNTAFDLMFIRHVTILLIVFASFAQGSQIDQGKKRLEVLQARSLNSSNRIINLTKADFDEFVMAYPRPYDVVIYFGSTDQYKLANQLFVEYSYLVKLYDMHGAINAEINPTFFAFINYSKDTQPVFKLFEFQSIPNMVVSKPHMAVVSQIQRKLYFQEYIWQITHTDNHVTTHKMLEFVNKRTKKDVQFRHTDQTIYRYVGSFAVIAVCGVLAYVLLKPVWNNWVFWFIGSIAVYLTCCSGIVYCILHEVPWTGRDKSGQESIFAGGSRQQSGLQGWVVSGLIVITSLMFVLIGVSGKQCSHKFSATFSFFAIVIIYLGVTYLEKVYGRKGWYGPSFLPPSGYLKGPLNVDQGNNI